MVHNETSTGVTSDIAAVRRAIDAAGHPALLMVDTISGLASADYRHDEWGVDVARQRLAEGPDAAAGHQLQRAVAEGARGAARRPSCRKAYWAWDEIVEMNKGGYWPYTPSTNLLYGLHESLDMILGQGLDADLRAPPALGRGGARRGARPGACRSSAPTRPCTRRC